MQLLSAVVLVVLLAAVSRAEICATYTAGDSLWSTSIASSNGANVTISSLVWLDTSPSGVINDLEIVAGGKLYFKPGQAITLRAKQIYIRPGGTINGKAFGTHLHLLQVRWLLDALPSPLPTLSRLSCMASVPTGPTVFRRLLV